MMTQMNIKIDSDLKQDVEYICQQLGLSITDAIRIFLKKLQFERGIPFELKLNHNSMDYEQNEETKKALNSKDFIELNSIDDLWSQYEEN